ncbi:NAD(P)/FAD-dependent oxidoreductase, partial [Cellulomonas bogoriensis]|uniref:NAD(P)/FAD-dependent oxidoreductase n=1 Tax=Cellulomonas bogoriensis TaxID=301388 RepID=UPI001E436A86
MRPGPEVDTDVLVVGGGPVGLAAAIEARLQGRGVVVVEPRDAPVDKACGEGLMPGALRQLHRLGVDPAGHVIAGIAYQAGRRRVEHRFASGAGRGVRRTVLHQALHDRALEVGVTVHRGRVTDLALDSESVRALGFRARWLLGCDGLHSTVRRLAGLDRAASGVRRYGLRAHARVEPWSDSVEVHWAPGCEAYVTPVDATTVGVALLGPRGSLSLGATGLETLRERLSGAPLG